MARVRDHEFGDAFREAIDARGLSLERVRAHLLSYGHDVSVATLSYWQTGRSIPVRRSSLQALGALEVILQVPRGTLASKLPSQQGRRAAPQFRHPIGVQPVIGGVSRITAELGLGFAEGYDVIAQDETVCVGSDRYCTDIAIDSLIVATRDGLTRLLVGYRSEIPGVLMDVTAEAGCRIGRTATVLSETLTAAEILLDQPVRAGEPFRYQVRATYDTPAVHVRDWSRLYLQPVHTTSLTLSFGPGDAPDCWLYDGPECVDPPYEPVRRTGCEVTIVREDFGPGLIAVRWAWPDDPAELIQPVRPLPEVGS